MKIGINERPKLGQWIVLSLQHVFAMFGATVLVPLLTGLDVGVALVASGVGTLIYIICTKGKVPVYLGSSFAYIAAISTAAAATGFESAYVGLMAVGLIYIAVALTIRFTGSGWLKKLLPPVIIGPMIMIIGLGLAGVAIGSAGLDGSAGYTAREISRVEEYTADYYILTELNNFENEELEDYRDTFFTDGETINEDIYYLVEVSDGVYETWTFIRTYTRGETVVVSNSAEKLFDGDKTIMSVYAEDPTTIENSDEKISTIFVEEVDGTFRVYNSNGSWMTPLVALVTFIAVVGIAIFAKGFFKIIPFLVAVVIGWVVAAGLGLVDWNIFSAITWNPETWFFPPEFKFIGTYALDYSAVLMFLPIAFVTIAEHIGDHSVLGTVCEKDFITDPGLDRTLLGDGIATAISAAIGGPANTTYGENTGVVAMTGVGSVWVTGLAAVFAIGLGFLVPIQMFIRSIPWAVIGGMTIVLYGLIAGNGVKVLIKDKTDLSKMRNIIIIATMLVIGLGGAVINFGDFGLTGMSLAAIIGIVLNLILPKVVVE